jgi:tripartite-type tricarboxylate transporter receptor subunit TctC
MEPGRNREARMTTTGRKGSLLRKLMAAIIPALAVSALAHPVAAQSAYPERGLTLIVPYPAGRGTDTTARRGTADAKTQVLGGHIQVLGANVSEAAEQVRAGKLRVLGVMAPARSRFLPDVPTFREQGLDQVWSVSRGVAAPAGLSKDVAAKLIGALQKILSSSEHRKRADALSLEVSLIAGDETARSCTPTSRAPGS